MKSPSSWSRTMAAAVVLSTHVSGALLWSAPAVHAQATSTRPATKPPVQRGQEYYEQARFDEAIGLLRDLVNAGALTGEELQRAREILARSYVKKGYPAQAKDMFKAMLRDDPTYKPDPIRVPPDETAVFEQAKREFDAEPKTTPAPAPRDTTAAAAPVEKSPPFQPVTVASTEKKSLMSQWWVWALGAVVVGGVVAAAAGGGGDDEGEPPLPGPPPPPPVPR